MQFLDVLIFICTLNNFQNNVLTQQKLTTVSAAIVNLTQASYF